MKKFRLLLVCALVALITSCNSDDNNDSGGSASFRAVINGEQWEATEFAATNGLIQIPGSNEQLLQISGDANGIRLRISISLNDIMDCMPEGDYEFPNRVDISYQSDAGGYIGGHFYDMDGNGNRLMTLTINSCANQTVSGTFTGTYSGTAGPDTPTEVVITNGVFENIAFEIFEQ